MESRILIVESQNEFALSMASALKDAGYQTAIADSFAKGSRELELRRPDLVIIRAELPDQSGFQLCAQVKKGKFGKGISVLLLSSDVGQEGLSQHAQGPLPAEGYLLIPFELVDFVALVKRLLPTEEKGSIDAEAAIDALFDEHTAQKIVPPPPPPPSRLAGAPPKLPRRERRSAITEEDRGFLEKTFQSIAERKAELLAESRELRRPGQRRELLATPEGKIQLLRDELKMREAQLARISEIWAARERELLSVEDRVHEKDVEAQGLRMRVEDLNVRVNQLQATIGQKDRDHGAMVDELLLQKFVGEKEVIEVVSAKEKEVNILRRELSSKDAELSRKMVELETTHQTVEGLERRILLVQAESETRERDLSDQLDGATRTITELRHAQEESERHSAVRLSEKDEALQASLEQNRQLTDQLHDFEARSQSLQAQQTAQIEQLNEQSQRLEHSLNELHEAKKAEADAFLSKELAMQASLAEQQVESEKLRLQLEEAQERLTSRLAEKDNKVQQLETELRERLSLFEKTEADLQNQIHQRLEQLGGLEGELEAQKQAAAEHEGRLASLRGELATTVETITTLKEQLSEKEESHFLLEQELGQLKKELSAQQTEWSQKNQALTLQQAAIEAQLGEALARTQKAEEHSGDAEEQLRLIKEELGARIAEVTRLTAQTAELEDKCVSLEDRVETLNHEFQRREELLQNDIHAANNEREDALQRMGGLNQERLRITEALQREQLARLENQKQWEAKLLQAQSTSQAAIDALNEQLSQLAHEAAVADESRSTLEARLERAIEKLSESQRERDLLSEQLDQASAHSRSLEGNIRAQQQDAAKALDEWKSRAQRAEQKLQGLTQLGEENSKNLENQLQNAFAQKQQATQRIRELENALEASNAARTRAEKEAATRAISLEVKLQEASVRLAAMAKDRRDLELHFQKESETLSARHRQELERREATRAGEVQKLMSTIQEKSRDLKVLELEVAKYKPQRTFDSARPPMVAPMPPPTPKTSQTSLADSADASTDRTMIESSSEEDWAQSLIEEFDK